MNSLSYKVAIVVFSCFFILFALNVIGLDTKNWYTLLLKNNQFEITFHFGLIAVKSCLNGNFCVKEYYLNHPFNANEKNRDLLIFQIITGFCYSLLIIISMTSLFIGISFIYSICFPKKVFILFKRPGSGISTSYFIISILNLIVLILWIASFPYEYITQSHLLLNNIDIQFDTSNLYPDYSFWIIFFSFILSMISCAVLHNYLLENPFFPQLQQPPHTLEEDSGPEPILSTPTSTTTTTTIITNESL